MRSKVEPMKDVAALLRRHLEGIVAWAHTRQANGFLEALNGLFQSAKRRARGFTRFETIRTAIFLIAGKPTSMRLTSCPLNRLEVQQSPTIRSRQRADARNEAGHCWAWWEDFQPSPEQLSGPRLAPEASRVRMTSNPAI
jgi:hypothetical protein